jgi:competence protein ComEA
MSFNIFGKEIEVNKTTVAVSITILIVIIGIFGFLISQKSGEIVIDKNSTALESVTKSATPDPTASSAATTQNQIPQAQNEEEIKVYVVGCVKKEGVVALKKGQIIDDAIKAAGGATKDADLRHINLACELNDNDMLFIYSKKASASRQSAKGSSSVSSSVNKNTSGAKIIKGSGGAIVTEKKTASDKSASAKVNINTATASELDALPGVGPATAQKIVAYRDANGKFSTIEDIKKVSGIGDSKYNSMRDLICVD